MCRLSFRAFGTAVLVGILGFQLIVPMALAWGQSGGGNKGGNSGGGNGGQNSTGNVQGPQQPSGSNQGPGGSGITGGGGGSMAIESVLFSYRGLAKDAENISRAVKDRIKNRSVVVATPADFASLIQWRTTMFQADLLDDRLTAATKALTDVSKPDFFKTVPKSVPTVGAGPFISGPSDVQALVQTLASIFAVNESVSASSGALTTTPLTNLLADDLRACDANVYVPSIYPPNLAGNADLTGTLIGAELGQLEEDLTSAVAAGQEAAMALSDANTVTTSPESGAPTITSISPTSGPPGTVVTVTGLNFGDQTPTSSITLNGTAIVPEPGDWTSTTIKLSVPTLVPPSSVGTKLPIVVTVNGKASNSMPFTMATKPGPVVPSPIVTPPAAYSHNQKLQASEYMASASSKLAALSSIVTAVQSFESTLLTGQAVPSGAQNNSQQQQTTGNANPVAGVGAPPLTVAGGSIQTTGQTTGSNNNATLPAISAITSPSPLQQILPADLLAQQIWGKEHPTKDDMAKVRILVIQTLESGGNQLTKSNLFLGSRVYFNGGAVATFGLFDSDGKVECGGFAYAYGGYAKDNDFSHQFGRGAADGKIESTCKSAD